MVDGHNESMATTSNFYCPYILVNSSKAEKWNVVVSQRIKIHYVATQGKEEKEIRFTIQASLAWCTDGSFSNMDL